MITFQDLKQKWDNLSIFENGFVRIDGDHPFDICIGYAELNQKTLLFIDTGEIEDLPSSKSIVAKNFQRTDGRWVVSFQLIRIETEDVFIRLCWDIIESSRDVTKNVVLHIIERYEKWLKLMEHRGSNLMSESMQKGLLGELLYLKELIEIEGQQKAVDSWAGPDGADQDFVYDSTWAEIKAIGISTESVVISSMEQLEVENEGVLIIYIIDKTTIDNSNGFSLYEKVSELSEVFTENLKAKEQFELKLFKYGYTDLKEYDKQKYRLSGKHSYFVNNDFPKLTHDNVRTEIVQTKYSISLAAVEKFKVLR